MTASRFNHYCRQGTHGNPVSVKLKIALTFKHQINLMHLVVIVGLRILQDIDKVHGGNAISILPKGTPGMTTRASLRLNIIKLGNEIVLLRSFHGLQSLSFYLTAKQAPNTTPSAVNTPSGQDSRIQYALAEKLP